MSILCRRALSIGAATANSFFAFACLLHGAPAYGQETPKQPNTLPEVQVEQPASQKPKAAAKKSMSKPKLLPAAVPITAQEKTQSPSDPSTALGSYNPALDLQGLELPPGTSITTAGPVDGYRALSAMSATKTATPINQLPQSIQVVPRSVIDDQRDLSVTEAVQNVSNVQGATTIGIGNTDLAPLKIRGFAAEQWLDGLVVNYNAGYRDAMANVERIEVLKGPNAILYGGGSGAPVGGAVNIISKLPTNVPGGEFGFTFGSNDYLRPYFDINQPLSVDGHLLFRVTGEYNSADSFVDVLNSDSYSINPTLTLTNKTDTTLTIQGRASRFKQQAYEGLPAVGTVAGDFRINRHLYIGPSDIPDSYSEVSGVTVTLDHRFDSIWSFNIKGRWSQSEFDQKSQTTQTAAPDAVGFCGASPACWSLINVDLAQQQEEFTINPNLEAKFAYGPTRNVFLIGGDYSRVTDRGHMTVDFGVLPVDLLNPSFPIPYTDPNPSSPFFFPFFDFNNVYRTSGVYTQLQSTIYDRIHILGGVRLANIDIDYHEKALFPPQTFVAEKTKALPRGGVVVDLFDGLSVYGSYSEGMRWAGFNQTNDIAPEESQEIEAGFKFDLGNHVSGTAAFFDINRSNIPVVVGVGSALLSQQHSQGFETDLIWQPNRNWKVLANYGFTDAEFADSLQGVAAGNGLPGVPQHSGRLWVDYAFDPGPLKGWSVGAGVYAASSQYVDSANVYQTDGYYTVDAKIGYENERISASFNVKNLTNEQYFVPYTWFGGQVAPGDDRTYYGTLVYKY